jgi:lysyl-tRNA synthetase class 2
VRVVCGDACGADLSEATVVFVYLVPDGLKLVEPALRRETPTFLYEWPAPLAALSRISPKDPRVAERVELYAGGLELGNGFGELTDAAEQRRRFCREQAQRRRMGREVYPVDEDFLSALGRMPPACGMAVGLERVVMLVTGALDIATVCAPGGV